jgi:hypothetical protein
VIVAIWSRVLLAALGGIGYLLVSRTHILTSLGFTQGRRPILWTVRFFRLSNGVWRVVAGAVVLTAIFCALDLMTGGRRRKALVTSISPGSLQRLARWPFLAELFFPHALIPPQVRPRYVTERAGPCYTAALVGLLTTHLAVAVLLPDRVGPGIARLAPGNFYSLQLDRARERLIAANLGDRRLEVYDVSGDTRKLFDAPVPTGELQDVRIDPAMDELYHFDRRRGTLLVLDLGSLRIKAQSPVALEGGGSARVAYDGASDTIAVTRENDSLWLVDRATLRPKAELPLGDRNEYILFSKELGAYALSYFEKHTFLRTVSPDGRTVGTVAADRHQGALAVAERRDELLVAMPLKSEIWAYDLPSLRPNRRVKTVFGVRSIAYDESNDLIVAASYVNGYVDILDAVTGARIQRVLVGYYLREICLNPRRREAYLSSFTGGLYRLRY